jgi:hypothetical protein
MCRRTWAETCDCILTFSLDLAEAADTLCYTRNPNALSTHQTPTLC